MSTGKSRKAPLKEVVDAALQLHRNLYHMCSRQGVELPALLQKLDKGLKDPSAKSTRDLFAILKQAWPKLNRIECVDICRALVQAASAQLCQRVVNLPTEAKILFPKASRLKKGEHITRRLPKRVSSRAVYRSALDWIALLEGIAFDSQSAALLIPDAYISTAAAISFRDDLYANHARIAAWMRQQVDTEQAELEAYVSRVMVSATA